jgi:AcrR family transcriptional regulator
VPSLEFETVRDLRRAQIIAEARALVAAEGLAGLTIGTLERRLPFSRGVITHHFRNKDEIVDAVLDSALDEIDTATFSDLAGAGTVEDMVRTVLRSKVYGFLEVVEACRILVSFWGRIPNDVRAAERNAALFRRYRGQALTLFEEGRAHGVLVSDLDIEAMAALMVGQVIGIVTQALFEPGAIDVDAAVEAAAQAIIAATRAPAPGP